MESDFEQLYRLYYMQVYSYVMTLSKSQDTSEEITQKTFLKVLTASQKYRGDSSELTWLCAIAKNLFIDECRSQKKTCELDTENASDIRIENAFVNEDSAFRIHTLS